MRTKQVVTIAIALTCAASPCFAQADNWTNATTTPAQEWTTAGNWSLGAVPTASQSANILNGGAVKIDSAVTFSSLSIGGGSQVDVSGPGTFSTTSSSLTVSNGTLDLGGTTQRQNGGATLVSGTIQDGSLISTGTITLEGGTVTANLQSSGGVIINTASTVTWGLDSYSQANPEPQVYTTTISAGTLILKSPDILASSALANNGTLDVSVKTSDAGNIAYLYSLSGSGTVIANCTVPGQSVCGIEINGGAAGTFSGTLGTPANPISLTADLLYGTQTLVANGANSAINVLQVENGTLDFGSINSFSQASVLVSGGSLDLSSGAVLGGPASSLEVIGDGNVHGNLGQPLVTLDLGGTTQTLNGGVSVYYDGILKNGTVISSGTFTLQAGTISAVLAGTGAVTMAGYSQPATDGIVTLSGANTYSGGTTVASGTLNITGSGTLGATTGSLAVTGGTLDLGGTTQTQNGGLTLSGGIIQNGTLSSSGTFGLQSGSVSAVLAGAGAINKTTSGTVILSGVNTYSGGTTIAGGTLSISSNGNLGSGGTVAMDAGTTLAFTATGTYSHAVTLAGDPIFDVASSQTVTYSGVIADGASAGTLEKTDSGTLILTAANTYTGGTIVAGGTLQTTGAGKLGASSGSVTVTSGTLDLGGTTQTQNGGVTLTSGTIQNGTLSSSSIFNLQAGSVSAVLAGAEGLTKTTSGTVTLSAVNTYTGGTLENTYYEGGTTVSAGTLQITGSGTLGSTSNSLTVSGGTVDLGGTTQTQNGIVTVSGGGVIQNGTLSSNVAFTLEGGTISANLAGLGLSEQASGTTVLSGNNTYATTIVRGGTLEITNNNALGTGIVQLNGQSTGGTLEAIVPGLNLSNAFEIIGDGGFINAGGNTLTLSGTIIDDNGPGTFTPENGTIVLAGSNTYSGGTVINSGATLQISGSGTLGAASGSTAISGTLNLGGTTQTQNGGVTLSGGTIQNGTLTSSGTFGLQSGTVSAVLAGAGAVNKTTSGSVVLSGVNTYTGGTTIATGTLSTSSDANLGNGGTVAMNAGTTLAFTATGIYSHAVTISGDPAFDVAGGQTVTYSGTIADGATPGTLEKTDSGTLILTAANTYSGGTIVAGGTLITTGSGTSGARSGNLIVSGGTLDLGGTTQTQNGGVTLSSGTIQNGTLSSSGTFGLQSGTVSAVLAGSGGLAKTAPGTVTLSGANAYTGGVNISAGILQISGSGTLGAPSGGITMSGGTLDLGGTTQTLNGGVTVSGGDVQDGTLSSSGVFALSGGTVSANLTGTGSLNITGPVTLTGTNSLSGAAVVATGGTLQITTSAFSASITDNGIVAFDQSGSGTYAGVISGSGGVTIAGSGDVFFTGANTYTGTTTISAGTLTVMGSVAGPVTVNGGKLNGNGTVGAVTIINGTFAPGDAVGTMHVNGNLTLASGTAYAVEVTPTAADEAIVSGTATIASGTTLVISPDAGTYSANTRYALLDASGGLTGTFSTVTYNGSFSVNVKPVVSYGADDVFLTLQPALVCNNTIAPSANRLAACNAIINGGQGTSLFLAASNLSVNASTASAALAQMSGDIHASMRSAMIEDAKIIRDTVINHAIAGSDGITMWGAGFGAYGAIDGDGDAADVHHNDSGVIMGADMPVMDGINVGLGAALTGQRIGAPSESASASGSTNHLIGYANWTDSEWVASLGWDYGWGANQVTRAITALAETDADHQSNKLSQVFGEVGYRIPSDTFDLMALEPYLDLADVSARTGAFTETGGIAALTGGAKSGSENYSTLGVRSTLPGLSLLGVKMVPDFNLGWQHAFTRFVSTQTLVFAGTGESFAVAGVPLDSDAAAMQVGFDVLLAPGATLDIGYDGEVSGRVQDHAFRANLDWRL